MADFQIDPALHAAMLLGAKPPQQSRLAACPAAPQVYGMALPPAVLDRSRVLFQPILGANDRLPDCTAVGIANAALAQAALAGYVLPMQDRVPVDFYARTVGLAGQDLSVLASSPGAEEAVALARLARDGMKTKADLLVGAWGTLADPGSQKALALAAARCGSAYLGIALAEADQGREVWQAQYADQGNNGPSPRPGSWGYHCLLLWDYTGLGNADTVRLATWGGFQKATWGWLRKAAVEAHVVIFRQLMPAAGLIEAMGGESWAGMLEAGRAAAGSWAMPA